MAGKIQQVRTHEMIQQAMGQIQQQIADLEKQIVQVEAQQIQAWGRSESEQLNAQFDTLSNRLRVARGVLGKLSEDLVSAEKQQIEADYLAAQNEWWERKKAADLALEQQSEAKRQFEAAEQDTRYAFNLVNQADYKLKDIERRLGLKPGTFRG